MRYLLFAILLASCAPGGLGTADDAGANRNYHREPPPILQAVQTRDGSWE